MLCKASFSPLLSVLHPIWVWGGGLGGVGLAAWCRSRHSGVGVLPCPTTRLNNLTVRFQGRADYRQPPDPTEALVGGRYRRPVCRRARGQGLGWAVGCGARGPAVLAALAVLSACRVTRTCRAWPRCPGRRGSGSLVSRRPPSPSVSLGAGRSRGGGVPGGGHLASYQAGRQAAHTQQAQREGCL